MLRSIEVLRYGRIPGHGATSEAYSPSYSNTNGYLRSYPFCSSIVEHDDKIPLVPRNICDQVYSVKFTINVLILQ